ncbi:hypothetical protein O4H49_13995 [Kiloniella laminariae]|uniref:Uncharacterized protein n=1 Tax=Kiloniella laminariae TaxID=454162 RepID=A0ABT4LLB6_9PROT|nr:hypothetical protein [Kiloniella laminariae]MCZ4281898.1 hypothetical protein [Kiloniella laminariae]
MTKKRVAALLCALVLAVPAASYAQSAYMTPNSIVRKPLLKPGLSSSLPKREPYLGSRLLYKTTDTLDNIFINDAGLSRACQRGRFLQVKEMQYIAVVDGRKYGAALYRPNMIHDPKNLADKDRIYLFKSQGTSNCQVFHKLI